MIEPCKVNKEETVTFGFYDYRPFRRGAYGKPEIFHPACENRNSHDERSNVKHQPSSSAEIKERVEVYTTLPLGLHGLL
jgi:hypothetical protein